MTQVEFETTRGQAVEMLRQLWMDVRRDYSSQAWMSQIEEAARLIQSLEPLVRPLPVMHPPMSIEDLLRSSPVIPMPNVTSDPDKRYERWKNMAKDMHNTTVICEKAMKFIPNMQFPPEDGIRDTGGLSIRLTEVNHEYRGLI